MAFSRTISSIVALLQFGSNRAKSLATVKHYIVAMGYANISKQYTGLPFVKQIDASFVPRLGSGEGTPDFYVLQSQCKFTEL
jgi:hypothetical protein